MRASRWALVMLLCAGCKPVPAVPERPASVAPAAVWAGGADGGAWIACDPALRCTVWHEDGALAQRGSFVGQAGRPIAWTGHSLLLFGGGELLPDGWHDFGDVRVRYRAGEELEKR